jgi:predicted flavoprotein YhiN
VVSSQLRGQSSFGQLSRGRRMSLQQTDIAIVGGGAAGLAAGIFAARRAPGLSIVVLDGAKKLGAKILVSGGGRCNVTNAVVRPGDYWGGNSNVIKRVLNALPVERTVAFFREIGVALHEEANGKLFPDSNSARTVLDALLREAERVGIQIVSDCRVVGIERQVAGTEEGDSGERRQDVGLPHPPPKPPLGKGGKEGGQHDEPPEGGFVVWTSHGAMPAHRVVLATGGQSLPKTGSDGQGYELARRLGHSLVPTTPALAPLVLEGDFHSGLTGVSQDVELTIRAEGAKPVRLAGSMLWTHFGVSGPVAMNASRHWHRARLDGRPVRITANLLPGESFESLEQALIKMAGEQPRTMLHSVLTQPLASGLRPRPTGLRSQAAATPDAPAIPARVAMAILERLGIGAHVPLAHLGRDQRRRLVHALLEWPLEVRNSRGYSHAEATAGGVPLDEINPATMESRKRPGLFLVGEILDVDGRIGGFNFHWAWASACVAAAGMTR